MKRWCSATVLVVFILWLIPLGVFIAPSKEKMFCDGQRAICLCSHHHALQKKSETGETVVKATAASQKEEHSGSSSQYYVTYRSSDVSLQIVLHIFRQTNLYHLIVCRLIDHVPKV